MVSGGRAFWGGCFIPLSPVGLASPPYSGRSVFAPVRPSVRVYIILSIRSRSARRSRWYINPSLPFSLLATLPALSRSTDLEQAESTTRKAAPPKSAPPRKGRSSVVPRRLFLFGGFGLFVRVRLSVGFVGASVFVVVVGCPLRVRTRSPVRAVLSARFPSSVFVWCFLSVCLRSSVCGLRWCLCVRCGCRVSLACAHTVARACGGGGVCRC